MDPLLIAVIVAVFTLIVLFSGIPIAFGLSFVSIALLVSFEGFQMLDVFAETFYAGLNSFVLLFAIILSATSFWNINIKISYQGGHLFNITSEANILVEIL